MAATGMWALQVICHQLRSVDNLGAIARAMANFGFKQLVLSDPLTHDFRGVDKLGVKADDVVETMAVAATLDEALARCVFSVGTTSRSSVKRREVLSPEEGLALLRQHAARGPVALVLGGEKRGLSDDELARCQAVVAIPTPGPQPSMNVASAAAVLLYLASRAEAPVASVPPAGAPLALVGRLERKLLEVLTAAEFLNPQAPEHVLGELVRSLVRQGLTEREAQLWLAAADKLGRAVKPKL
jgi:tRNA/rRNA methyltransferase